MTPFFMRAYQLIRSKYSILKSRKLSYCNNKTSTNKKEVSYE